MKSFLEFKQQINEETLDEVLSKSAPASEWIDDFVNSDDPKFAGKSKEKRKEMALAAYYAKQRNEEVDLDEAVTTPSGHKPISSSEYEKQLSKMHAGATEHPHGYMKDGKFVGKQHVDVRDGNHITQTYSHADLKQPSLFKIKDKEGTTHHFIKEDLKDTCWKGYEAIGTKKKNGKEVPNCVPVKEAVEMTHAQIMKKIKDGTHEATTDIKPGKHVELRHNATGKTKMVMVKHNPVKEEALEEGARGTFHAGSKSYFKAGQSAIKKAAQERAQKEKDDAEKESKLKTEEIEIEESRGHSIIASKLAQIASRSSEQGKSPAQIRAEKEKEEKQKQSKLGEGMISYSEFMAKLEESRIDDLRDKQAAEKEAKKDAYEAGEKAKPTSAKRTVKGHSYGADDENDGDEEGEKKVAKPEAEKRGRGRPAGSKSGARR